MATVTRHALRAVSAALLVAGLAITTAAAADSASQTCLSAGRTTPTGLQWS